MIFLITVPYVSPKLSRTFQKNLEVYEYDEIDKCVITLYRYKNGKWVNTNKPGRISFYYDKKDVKTELVQKLIVRGTTILAFETLELVIASKVILINDMRTVFDKKIQELTNNMNKNVPDVKHLVQEIKENSPELFI